MDFEVCDKFGIFGLFVILVLLNLDRHWVKLYSIPFHSTVPTTALYIGFMIIPRFGN